MNFNAIKPLPVRGRQSCINCAVTCERKWFYQYRMGVVLRGTEFKEAATLGTIYHVLQCAGPGKESEVRAWIREQQTTLMDAVDRGEDLDGNSARLAGVLTTLYNKAEVMAHVFWEMFPQPPQFKTLAKEIKVTAGYKGLILEGTIDKLLLNTKDDSIWIRDHKTTGRPLAVLFGGLPWSIQARIYRILALNYMVTKEGQNKEWAEKNIKGFILDGILKPGIKLCKTDEKNAKTWKCSVENAYLRRVKEWYKSYEVKAELAGKPNTKALDSKGILYTEPMFPDELKTVLYKMMELSQRDIHPAEFERDVTRQACFAYEKQCIYHSLCETDPTQWDRLFEIRYKIKEASDQQKHTEKLNKIMDMESAEAKND